MYRISNDDSSAEHAGIYSACSALNKQRNVDAYVVRVDSGRAVAHWCGWRETPRATCNASAHEAAKINEDWS